jgi:hypothetical protein
VYVLPRVVDEHNASAGNLFGTNAIASRDWVDDSVSSRTGAVEGPINSRARAPFFNPGADRAVWWELEFWNKAVDRVYRLGDDTVTTSPSGPRRGAPVRAPRAG